jgi:tripartite-type tricarboxylate transporter receptor subunit TctC
MPGAGGFKAIEYLYKVAPQDGTHLGSVAQQMAMTALVDEKLGIDPTKLNYLGRLTAMIDIAVALPKSGITSFEDARKREITVGAGQSTSTSASMRALSTPMRDPASRSSPATAAPPRFNSLSSAAKSR